MIHQYAWISTLAAVFLFTTGACSDINTNSTAVGGYESGNGIETKADSTLPELDSTLVKTGETHYKQNCAACHQKDAIGKPGIAPSLTNPEFLSVASEQFLRGTIIEGRAGTGMPPFGHLEANQITAIIAYLRSHATLPSRATAVDAEPQAHGDPRLGKVWYDQICSTCHGPNGDGYAAGGTGTAIGNASFLNKATDGFLRVTIKEGRSNTRMLSFQGPASLADLSDKEINDIIVYLRSLSKPK